MGILHAESKLHTKIDFIKSTLLSSNDLYEGLSMKYALDIAYI